MAGVCKGMPGFQNLCVNGVEHWVLEAARLGNQPSGAMTLVPA